MAVDERRLRVKKEWMYVWSAVSANSRGLLAILQQKLSERPTIHEEGSEPMSEQARSE
ncbi:MAG: hypothetical protein QXO76_05440 [Thermoproteota archaeon]